jgi:hypothetical protein
VEKFLRWDQFGHADSPALIREYADIFINLLKAIYKDNFTELTESLKNAIVYNKASMFNEADKGAIETINYIIRKILKDYPFEKYKDSYLQEDTISNINMILKRVIYSGMSNSDSYKKAVNDYLYEPILNWIMSMDIEPRIKELNRKLEWIAFGQKTSEDLYHAIFSLSQIIGLSKTYDESAQDFYNYLLS